ncbi:hypothetical protein PDJAM_G00156250 [Pangasius djambal]|uniref:Uncharacterized protein n=1 Tax=Pangasius djambal TaxID=1691987 RepID=A0ACC5ZJJ2_9TELE|nr:hypothetical protein [Pangasius djambal]
MSEESFTSQDKEELKRRLELLQKEYERTAQRLQRAERREAVRKHVLSTISEQNRLLHSNTSAILEQNSSSSPEQLSNRNVPSDTTKVRFHLPDASPFSALACKRSPSRAHRLRSKRSRLRLQIRERESDTEETKVRFHLPDASPFSALACKRSPSRAHRLRSKRSRLRLQIRERESDTEESQEKTREGTEERWREECGERASESERTSAEKEKDVERGREEEDREREEEDREKTETLKDGLKKTEENVTPVILHSAAESSSVHQSPLTKLLAADDPPADQSALRHSPSASSHSSSSDHSGASNETSSQSCSGNANDAEKSPGSAAFLTSCTLIEGLPFPVEYYVRTTRRMASAHSSVDLNAVIQSQLSNGRGRRRSSRGRVTSIPSSEKPPDKSGCEKRGPRGRRGRRRARESDSSGQSESLLQSPSSLPQEESEAFPSPRPSSHPAPDSPPQLSRELSPDSEVYPIFRKRRGRAGVSRPQIPASVNDSSHLLPSLTSLAEALRAKDFRSPSGLLTKFDVQDFHLPDDEFGQLKLERLCSSCSNAESVAYSAGFRKNRSTNVPGGGQVENEKVVLDPLPHGASLESSLPLTERSRAETGNADQSEREITSQALDKTRETEDPLYRSVTNQAEMLHNRDTQQIKPDDPHTHSASRSLLLNLSMSLTSHTPTGHNTSLISLGATPNVFPASPSSELTPLLLSSDQDLASKQSGVEVNNGTPENEDEEPTNVSVMRKVQMQGRDVSEHTYSRSYRSDVSKTEVETPEPANNVLINAEVEIQGCDVSDEKRLTQVTMSTPKVRFHLPDASPFSALACKRSPSRAHRLRSKRSRLRLQIRERESDTEESQEKTREGTEERRREERGERASESERTSAEKEKDVEREREEEDREKTETLKDGLKKTEENVTPVILHSAAESSSVHQSPLTKLLAADDPPADQSALRHSPSASSHSSSSDHSGASNETSSQSCSGNANDAEKSPGSAAFLTSCTLIEGLPFPVEYYVRTTRRMASAHSSVDLNAVIQSQLSNGRGRRRSSRGRVTSIPSSEKPPDKSGCKKRGPRGRRGRRRARESDSSGQSESLLQSPSSLPQEESEAFPSPRPSSHPALDSPPQLSRELSPDSEVYPIFRKRRGRAGVSRPQIPASVNDSSHLLPSLTSLAEALRAKDFRSPSGLLTKFDVQDFHLPDDEFGQLKLERLCSSCSNAESVAYSAGFRKNGSTNVPGGGQVENEKVVLDPLPHGASLESSLPLTERSRAETGNADQSEREITSQALDKTRETEDPLYRSVTNQAEMLHNRDTQQIKPDDPHTHSASRSLLLNLSMSLTSHTPTGHNTSLISLGATPNVFPASPSSELTPLLLSSDQDLASKQSGVEVNNGTPENEDEEPTNVSVMRKVQMQGRDVSEHTYSRSYRSDVSKTEVETPEPANNVLINAEVEIQGCDVSDEKILTQALDGGCVLDVCLVRWPSDDWCVCVAGEWSVCVWKQKAGVQQWSLLYTWTFTQSVISLQGIPDSSALLCALDGGCVLDVCLVRWPSDDWCVCVAGEWSVCVWKQKAGVQQWSLLYTWTFTQSVISLQGIPDSSALLCVCVGRLEITEARILYCPSTDSEFSQAELCKGALQAVLAVSDHRVACCSAPGPQQNVQVFTLAQDGRITETLSLVSTSQTIQTLVSVEREKDALIGWTEQKSLLIWNMKSGQLLQTIRLAESVSTATCLRGYSCRGALCVLLQQTSACPEETGSSLFTLIATNPLTGKHFTLRTISSPSAPTERLIDGDVCESVLVGVYQSGLAIWKFTGGVACAYANEPAEVCRLARWAGPNTLLTGYLNGDVNIYQFTPTETSTEFKDS